MVPTDGLGGPTQGSNVICTDIAVANGNCEPYNAGEFECKCLPGFEPKFPNDWYLKEPSGGCVRKRHGVSTCRNGEGFVKVANVKVPDTSTTNVRGGGSGCITWDGDLVDPRQYSEQGQELYIRVDSLELDAITINQPIVDGDIIVSAEETFALGFFSPRKSSYRYLGICGSALWQSFEYPTNIMLPNLKLGLERRTGLNWFLTSWKSSDDPGTGNFLYRINPEGSPQLFSYERGFIFNVSYVNNENEISIKWGVVNGSILTRLVINESGSIQRLTSHEDECDSYELCGAFGNCVLYDDVFDCTCLPGYQPKSPQEWYMRDGSGGCVRKNQTALCRNGEGFVEVTNVKAPDTSVARVLANLDLKACKDECLRNCSCTAYTSLGVTEGSGCLTWYGDLLDTRVFIEGGRSFYVRVEALELAQYANKRKDLLAKKGILLIMILSISAAVSSVVLFSYREDQIEANTRRVVGTYYGVLMLEIISGKKNTGYNEESPSLNLIGNVWEL
ncbi:hypothetical protein GH714_019383 [Hevea brasiliensis]|uniref:non-specific serine/threonine protein kinase n=1 Tax=Hevea brasiliensis TaxID=3981 RepID=A0A6A6LSW9_HEVBR|nr:hypothetical protein GH714_019383 [Hevea brasiliensis]